MKTIKNYKIYTLLGVLLCLGILGYAQDLPDKPQRLVNDFSQTLSSDEVATLEQKLRHFNDTTSTQISLVLIPSLQGYEISDYGIRLAEHWGIGQKGKNNGILLLVAVADRKVTIQVGYGLEAVLPDALAKRIIQREIRPSFKRGAYYEGLDKATDAIIMATKGEYTADGVAPQGGWGAFGVVIGVMLFIIILGRMANKRGGTVIGGRGGSDILFWSMMGGSGFGGRSSGGGSDFGGFGGGSFGGGGASGSW